MYGGIFAVNLELTGDNEPLLEENDRQRCQLVANQLPTVFRASFRSTKRPATTATNSQLSILSPDFLPYRDLETSITALVDSNAFALSLPLFLLSD